MSTPEIVKATVEIVPRPNLEGVEVAIGKLATDTAKLVPLRTRAEALIAKGAPHWTVEDCQAAKLRGTHQELLGGTRRPCGPL
jgi:hypothetical protein